MAEPNRVGGTTFPITYANAPYHPLGARIKKIAYELPPRFADDQALVDHLKMIHLKIQSQVGSGTLPNPQAFYQELGLSTANLESFRQLYPKAARQFDRTITEITNKIITSSAAGTESWFSEASHQVAEFLWPLVFLEIPEDSNAVWGYPVQLSTAQRFGASMPPSCALDSYRNRGSIEASLHNDLIESFDRRNKDPQVDFGHEATRQCNEPQHPARYRINPHIEGSDQVNEGETLVLSTGGSVSQMEAGSDYQEVQPVPVESRWQVDPSPWALQKMTGNRVVFHAPSVFRDTQFKVRLTMVGPYGIPQVAEKEITILNTVNEPPTVTIQGPRETSGDVPVMLTAEARDPNGDPLTYHWKQMKGPPVQIIGASDSPTLQFLPPLALHKSEKVIFQVTVTDQPQGLKPGPARSTQSTHQVTTHPTPGPFMRPHPPASTLDPKRQGLIDIALAGGGKPRTADKGGLVETLKAAATPDDIVDTIDLEIAIDASKSMDDDVQLIRDKVPELLEEMRQKVKGNDLTKIRIGIVSYVDDRRIVHLHLQPVNPSTLQAKLSEVIHRIQKEGGTRETVWDALFDTIDEEHWSRGANRFRKLVYITDEAGNPGKEGKTKEDVARVAQRNQVIVDPIFIYDSASPFRLGILEIDVAYQNAMSHTDESGRIDAITHDYLPLLAKNVALLGGQDRTLQPCAFQMLDLYKGIQDPTKRIQVAREGLAPLMKDKTKEARALADHIYQVLILNSPMEERQRIDLGIRYLPEIGTFMGKRDFLFDLIQKVSSDDEKARLIETQFVPIMLKDWRSDIPLPSTTAGPPTVAVSVYYLGSLIQGVGDPQKRRDLARRHLLPLTHSAIKEIRDQAEESYRQIMR